MTVMWDWNKLWIYLKLSRITTDSSLAKVETTLAPYKLSGIMENSGLANLSDLKFTGITIDNSFAKPNDIQNL